MYNCEKVDLEYFNKAPFRLITDIEIEAAPEQIFSAFEDPEAWVYWVKPIAEVKWTSSKPFNKGTTRTVTMNDGLIIHEEFLLWEEYSRIAFYFTQISKAIFESLAEDYVVTDLGNGRSRVRWNFSFKAKGIFKILLFLYKPVMLRDNKKTLVKLKEIVESKRA